MLVVSEGCGRAGRAPLLRSIDLSLLEVKQSFFGLE